MQRPSYGFLECVRSNFKDYVLQNKDIFSACTTPWTLSLLQISNYLVAVKGPCNATEATIQTWEDTQFFINLGNPNISPCSGMYKFDLRTIILRFYVFKF